MKWNSTEPCINSPCGIHILPFHTVTVDIYIVLVACATQMSQVKNTHVCWTMLLLDDAYKNFPDAFTSCMPSLTNNTPSQTARSMERNATGKWHFFMLAKIGTRLQDMEVKIPKSKLKLHGGCKWNALKYWDTNKYQHIIYIYIDMHDIDTTQHHMELS